MAMLYTMKRNEGNERAVSICCCTAWCCCGGFASDGLAQAPSFRWAMEGVGSGGYDAANGAAVDAAGNVFVTGGIASSNLAFGGQVFAGYYMSNNLAFPPYQFFITKLDAFGNVLWVRQGE